MKTINLSQLNRLKAQNPNLDLTSFNFSAQNKKAIDRLDLQGLELEQIKGLQRLIDLTKDESQAIALYNAGLQSCFQVTAMSKEQFAQHHGANLGGDKQAGIIYQRAVARSSQLMMSYVNLCSHSESHFRAIRPNNVSAKTDSQHQHQPDYNELFGNSDYCQVPQDRSIFSPAAYLVDLIRFKDITIDDSQVDEKFRFSHRRPDLDGLVLDSATTETVVPKLEIVNSILEEQIVEAVPRKFRPLYNPLSLVHLSFFKTALSILWKPDAAAIVPITDPDQGARLNYPITSLVGTHHFTLGRKVGNAAFVFDGSTYLTTKKLNLGNNYTIAAWIKIASGEGGTIINNPSTHLAFSIGFSADSSKPQNSFEFHDNKDETLSSVQDDSRFRLTYDKWHHIAVTVEQEKVKLYFDGRLAGSRLFSDTTINAVLRIGDGFTGTMDSITVDDRVFDPKQIKKLAFENTADKVYPYLAELAYPFKLPFHLPLAQIRNALSLLKTDLPTLWRSFSEPSPSPVIAQEILRLSPEVTSIYSDFRKIRQHLRRAFETSRLDVRALDLDEKNVFLEKMGLTQTELNDLLFGDLDQQEIEAGLNKAFYINGAKINGVRKAIGIIKEKDKPDKLAPLYSLNLVLISRVIFLSRHLRWSFSDLDWALRTAGAGLVKLHTETFAVLSYVESWQRKYQRSIPELCSFIGLVKHQGKKQGSSFFERIFQPQHVLTDISFPDENLKWNFDDRDKDRAIHQTLVAALAVSEDDLLSMAKVVAKAFNVRDGLLPLGLEQLSALYRLCQIPRMLGMSIADAINVLHLMGGEHLNRLAGPPTVAATETIDRLAEIHLWLQTSTIPLAIVRFILTGTASTASPMQLGKDEIINFLNELRAALQSANPSQAVPINKKDMGQSETTQQKTLEAHLSSLLGVSQSTLAQIKRWTKRSLDDDQDFLSVLLKPLQDKESDLTLIDGLPQSIVDYFSRLNQCTWLVKTLRLTRSELQSILDYPEFFNIADVSQLTLADVHRLYQFKRLVYQYQDRKNGFIRYLAMANGLMTKSELTPIVTNDSEKDESHYSRIEDLWTDLVENKTIDAQGRILTREEKDFDVGSAFESRKTALQKLIHEKLPPDHLIRICQELGQLTQWDNRASENASQIVTLVDRLWPSSEQKTDAPPPYGTVDGLLRMKQCFELSKKLGLTIPTLMQVADLSKESRAYEDFAQAATTLLSAVKAKYNDTSWEKVYQPIQVNLNQQKRDALVAAVMVRLQQKGIPVKTTRDLYEYLLIDVDVSGLVNTSWLKEALGCLQTYIYRCHMQLEKEVTLSKNFNHYWDWIKNYRVWEANRKVFLYPENYIQPDLRKNKTPLFAQLEQDLQQTHLGKESVDKAVKTYLNGFAEVANLQYGGSYVTQGSSAADPNHPDQILYLLGRTNYPYQYYYRTAAFAYNSPTSGYTATAWQPWIKIGLNILGKYPSPIFAFNKLFIFWVEIKPAPADRENASQPEKSGHINSKRFEACINYSFYDFNKNWVAPQPLGEPILLPKAVNTKEKTEDLDWQRIHLSFGAEQLFVSYPGFFTALDVTLKRIIPTPRVNLSNGNVSDGVTGRSAAYSKNSQGIPSTAFKYDGKAYHKTDVLNLGKTYTFAAWVKSEFDGGIVFEKKSTALWLQVRFFDSTGGAVEFQNDDGFISPVFKLPTFRPNTWHHLALTVNLHEASKQANLFIDGQSFWSSTEFSSDVDDVIHIGSHFSGMLDQVYFFSATLSAEQIQQLATLRVSKLDLDYGAFSQLPRDAVSYPIPNSLNWSILSAGKSEYLSLYNGNSVAYTKCIRLNATTIHSFSHDVFADGIDGLYTLKAQQTPEDSFKALGPSIIIAHPWPSETLDFQGANGLYYWELFFHTPFLVAKNLNTAQQFELAQQWYHYIFDPTVTSDVADLSSKNFDPNDRYWRFLGLRSDQNTTLQAELKRGLNKELQDELTDKGQIDEYYRDPFDPHAIAQLRPVAYQKTLLMHYIDNLLAWGDQLFRQDTRETLVEATLLYVMAYDLLGPKPNDTGKCALPSVETLGAIKGKYAQGSAIPEFLVGLEQVMSPDASHRDAVANPNNFIPGLYFGIPENEQFIHYWQRVQQRLHNIRFNLTIDGKPNHLPLFQPPISPMQLVQAVAEGEGVSQALAAMTAPVPFYRFAVMLDKAKNATNTVIQFGNALMSALEKQDAEQLARLRTTHEQALLTMNRLAKKDQVESAQTNVAALEKGLVAAKTRQAHYAELIQKGLSALEQQQFSLEQDGINKQTAIRDIKIGAAIAYLVPTVYGLADGDFNPGDAANQAAQTIEAEANVLNQRSGLAAAKAQYQRRAEDWQLQQTLAEDDISQISQQLEAAQTQVDIAKQELSILEKNIQQSQDIETFLKKKFTDKALYQWMMGRLSALYFQTYQLAYSLAVSAQRAWQFERAHEQTIIQPGYWNDLHKGLLAGEGLMLGLLQMEKAYLDQGQRRLEIIKTIPLSSLADGNDNPLDDLIKKGKCHFELAQDLFEADYNHHYCRQIKSLTLSIPALLGPYQNIHATLTQDSNTIHFQPNHQGVPYLRALQQIALSQGLNDSGLFELNFHDERYLPFEGTGAISKWTLEIPIDKNVSLQVNGKLNLTDVIIELHYTALAAV